MWLKAMPENITMGLKNIRQTYCRTVDVGALPLNFYQNNKKMGKGLWFADFPF